MDSMKHFEYTYVKPSTHHQEPPPTGIKKFDIQAENGS